MRLSDFPVRGSDNCWFVVVAALAAMVGEYAVCRIEHPSGYDDRVIEAGLSIRPQDRLSLYEMKPIAKQALRGIAPDESLNRNTKNVGSYASEAGFREHVADLTGLFTDSHLGRLGLIDEDRIKQIIGRPNDAMQRLTMHFYGPIAAEKFARRAVTHGRNDVVHR